MKALACLCICTSSPERSLLEKYQNFIYLLMFVFLLYITRVNEVHGSLENMEREKAKQAMRRRRTTSKTAVT